MVIIYYILVPLLVDGAQKFCGCFVHSLLYSQLYKLATFTVVNLPLPFEADNQLFNFKSFLF